MITAAPYYTDSRYRAYPGEGYDGVVRISSSGYYGTGTLLFDGRAVLTAAHLFSSGTTSTRVIFETSAGMQTVSATKVLLHPGYDTLNNNNDLALVWLAQSPPPQAERYGLYRKTDEIGMVATMVGYGLPGTGATGMDSSYSGTPLRLKARNSFDADTAELKAGLGAAMSWTPLSGTQLVADFDDGSQQRDVLGRLLNRPDTGQGLLEGLLASGDSGGPAFINGLVAGVASYTASLVSGAVRPDVDTLSNSSFGEIAAWQRVSSYQQWIDQSMRAQYSDAPTRPEEVKTSIVEGNSGSQQIYFLLQFTGVRQDPQQWLSVDYRTRDGTAKAGEDYFAVSGTCVLYPGEDRAVIVVEVLGDRTPEPDETFYLDVFNPVGGSFGPGLSTLAAMRTISDDDGWWG